MSLCFQCLFQECLWWYPDVIGYPIQVARFDRDDDHFLPEFNMPALSPGVEEKGDWLQLAYFNVAEMYMPLKHDYLDFFYSQSQSLRLSLSLSQSCLRGGGGGVRLLPQPGDP